MSHNCEVCCMSSTDHEPIYGQIISPPCCPGCSCGSYQKAVTDEIDQLTADKERLIDAIKSTAKVIHQGSTTDQGVVDIDAVRPAIRALLDAAREVE